ncbi:MAG: acyl carrier protein [Dehalococcoidia bacterium]
MPVPVPGEQQVKEIIADVWMRSSRERELAWNEIENDFPLYSLSDGEESLGLDSLDAIEIATELEEAFDVVMPTELEPADLRTVSQLVTMLERLRQEQHGSA